MSFVGDTDNELQRKILSQLGGTPRPGDFDNTLYRKILEELGGIFRPGDSTSELLRKIATQVGGGPRPGDTTNKLLYRITAALGKNPRPGDFDNILLRKIAGSSFPSTLLEDSYDDGSLTVTPNQDDDGNPIFTVIITNPAFIGSWISLRVSYTAIGVDPTPDDFILVGTQQVLSIPFVATITAPAPGFTPAKVCGQFNVGPTEAAAILARGGLIFCGLVYPPDFPPLSSPPLSPTATAASSITTTGFSANWNPNANTTGFRLDVATDSGFTSFVSGFNNLNVAAVTSYAVTGLTANTTYYYRVRAVNTAGTSANSNTITQDTTPTAPTATAASSILDTTFSANWNSVTGATSYRLDVATDAGFTSFVSGFNDLNVGNVVTYSVTGLAANTTYFYRIRAVNSGGTGASSNTISPTTDTAEAVAWKAAVISNGGTVSAGSYTAVNTFITSLYSNSLRSLIYRLNFYGGNQLAACAVPVIHDQGGSLDILHNFVGGDYTEATGLTGNGTTKYNGVDDAFNLNAFATINDLSFGTYIRTDAQDPQFSIGARESLDQSKRAVFQVRFTDDNTYIQCGDNGSAGGARVVFADGAGAKGLYHASRTASNSLVVYKNGSNAGSTATPGGSLPGCLFYVHAAGNELNVNPIQPTAKSLGGYFVAKGMNATQAGNFYTIWQTLMTAFGRNV